MQNELIKHMVDRFLAWRLPDNFNPDAGISFDKVANLGTEHQYYRKPSGTNLFDAVQAEAMVRHMVDGFAMPSEDPALREALIKKAEAALHDGRFFHGRVTNGDLRLAIEHGIIEHGIDATLSTTPTPCDLCKDTKVVVDNIGLHSYPETAPCPKCCDGSWAYLALIRKRPTPTPAPIDNEALVEAQPNTVEFVREWMLSGDHPISQWEQDFAKAIDARSTPDPLTDEALVEEAVSAIQRMCLMGEALARDVARAVLALPLIARSEARTDTYWLIERRCSPPQWANIPNPTGAGAFHSDIHAAHRFSLRRNAEEAMRAMRITAAERGDYFVSEHAWISATVSKKEIVQSALVEEAIGALEKIAETPNNGWMIARATLAKLKEGRSL